MHLIVDTAGQQMQTFGIDFLVGYLADVRRNFFY